MMRLFTCPCRKASISSTIKRRLGHRSNVVQPRPLTGLSLSSPLGYLVLSCKNQVYLLILSMTIFSVWNWTIFFIIAACDLVVDSLACSTTFICFLLLFMCFQCVVFLLSTSVLITTWIYVLCASNTHTSSHITITIVNGYYFSHKVHCISSVILS